MGGIRDYTYQNIIFVHDFVFIFLILVFITIIAYFGIVLYEYNLNKHNLYFRLFMKDFLIPQDRWLYHLYRETAFLLKMGDVEAMREARREMSPWVRTRRKYSCFLEYAVGPVIIEYSKYMRSILDQVHNLSLEVIWTFIPIVIILELIFPSLSLIADDEISSKASIYAVNVIGNQWYWVYELNTAVGVLKQVSELVPLEDISKYSVRLLETTNAVAIPVGLKTSFFITSNDVAHSWAIPGLGLKIDAIPGRINLKTIIASKLGLYSGMCSELCGIEHGFMPISLKVLTLNAWGYDLEYAMKDLNDNLLFSDITNVWYL